MLREIFVVGSTTIILAIISIFLYQPFVNMQGQMQSHPVWDGVKGFIDLLINNFWFLIVLISVALFLIYTFYLSARGE